MRQQLFHSDELLDFAFEHLRNRNAGPLGDDLRDVFFVDLLFQHALVLLHFFELGVRFLQLALEFLDLP